jgi:hypothetical protein
VVLNNRIEKIETREEKQFTKEIERTINVTPTVKRKNLKPNRCINKVTAVKL